MRSKGVSFNQLDDRNMGRIRYLKVSEDSGEEVPAEHIVKGVEVSKGRYVLVDPDELAPFVPLATKTIEVEEFVDLADIDPVFFESSYYVAPHLSQKPYALLARALESAGKVAIVRYVMRSRQYTGALRADQGRLVLSTLAYADEIIPVAEVEDLAGLDMVEVSDREVKMAEMLVESLTDTFDRRECRVPEPSKRVVGYARVSVDAPDKVSPEMQAEAIEAQCKLKGWELVDLIVERGRSAGEGKKRPGLDRARKLIRTGKANGLVVWKIDRCSRSVRDFAEILAELREHDADFVSVTESSTRRTRWAAPCCRSRWCSPSWNGPVWVSAAAAWQAYRAKQGGTPTTRAILGYRRVDGQLLLDEQTAPIVKQAVEILLESGSLSAAAGFLRYCGHPKYLSAARSSAVVADARRRPLRRWCLRPRGMAGTH